MHRKAVQMLAKKESSQGYAERLAGVKDRLRNKLDEKTPQ